MYINFETLFNNVQPTGEPVPEASKSQFAESLIQLIRDAKGNDLTGYDVIEAAYLQVGIAPEAETAEEVPGDEEIAYDDTFDQELADDDSEDDLG
jgi:hypothetical protein